MIGQEPRKNERVISSSARKTAYRTQSGNREWVTLIECVNGEGHHLPGFYIYGAAKHNMGWHHSLHTLDDRITYVCTHNGWTNDLVGTDFTKHFNKHAPPSAPDKWRLLLCDNHSSHDTFEFFQFSLDHRIELFFFPSHLTHILQSVDVGVYSSLDRAYKHLSDTWLAQQPAFTTIHKGDFIPLCEKARERSMTKERQY
jgi:hypothetical protein